MECKGRTVRDFEFYYGVEKIKNDIIKIIKNSSGKTPAIYQECAQKLAYYQAEFRIGLFKEDATRGIQRILFILRNIKPLDFQLNKYINTMYKETIRRIQEYGDTRKQEND